MVQLNKCETDPYFLKNFQCTMLFISAFCKICELNTEHEIAFVLISVDSQGDMYYTGVISGSHKWVCTYYKSNQTNWCYYFGKSEDNTNLSCIYLPVNS